MVERELGLLRHPRLAAVATHAWPAWLWSADGSRILWANAAGAAIFGAANVTDLEQRRFVERGLGLLLLERKGTIAQAIGPGRQHLPPTP